MSTLRSFVLGCVSDRSQEAGRAQASAPYYKVKFGVPLSEALKEDRLPIPLVDMLVYIAQEGVTTTDLFRRPGNPSDAKVIMKRLSEGKEVVFTNYNFYTLASVVKKFLLRIPGGVFGTQVEQQLLGVLPMKQRMEQYEEIHRILSTLPQSTQQLVALLFGTWFRIVNHSEYNTMSSEAVAKSVAGSLFHTCSDDPAKVEKAVQVLQILIDDFGVANMFGRSNIQYFADKTRTGIRVQQRFRYEYEYPPRDSDTYEQALRYFALLLHNESLKHGFRMSKDAITEDEFYGQTRSRTNTRESEGELRLPSSPPSPQSLQPQPTYTESEDQSNPHKKLTQCSSLSAPEVNTQGCSPTQEQLSTAAKRMYQSSSLSRFDNVRRRQIIRMKKRSNWFLAPNTSGSSDGASVLGSREASVGKSSDAMSSDALMSDVTASDGAMSDTQPSDALRMSSDIDSSYLDETHDRTTSSIVESFNRSRLMPPDIVNGNHATSTPRRHTTSEAPSSRSGGTPSPSQPSVTERDVRYFMVENWYMSPGNTNNS